MLMIRRSLASPHEHMQDVQDTQSEGISRLYQVTFNVGVNLLSVKLVLWPDSCCFYKKKINLSFTAHPSVLLHRRWNSHVLDVPGSPGPEEP